MKRLMIAAAMAALATGGTAIAQEGGPYDLPIAARQGIMAYLQVNVGTLGAMAQGKTPYDATAAKAAADNVAAAANLDMSMLWPQGSDSDSNMNTRALPEIWAAGSTIGEKSKALKDAAAAMQTAAGTDLAALQGAMKDLGGACAACHKEYRASE